MVTVTGEQKSIVINWAAIVAVIIAGVVMIAVGDLRENTVQSSVQSRFVTMHSEQLLSHSQDLRAVSQQLQSHDVRIARTEAYIEDVHRRLGEMHNTLKSVEKYMRSRSGEIDN